VKPNATYTKEECRERDERNARHAWDEADRLVDTEMTWGQHRAYADYVFNAGSGNFSISSMRTYANQGMVQESCDAFRQHMMAGPPGKKVDCRIRSNKCFGIVSRREWERKICLSGDAL
jgi:GH24 family phage-related lysozyme (muramidase)